eukprot:GEMP01012438.1.p1 GENE.GEMP01012438.1~~GEMP01012438.1.p1  ORF type:complete len:559 (+),score=119.71 GEMP01012438.1:429-2105(+)
MGCAMSFKSDSVQERDVHFDRHQFIHSNRGQVDDMYDFSQGSLLGRGCSASVYKVRDRITNRLRAIKSISKSRRKCQSRLYREIDIMKEADHPHIVKLYETFEDAQNVYLVMELCDGGDLFSRVTTGNAFTEGLAATIMKQIFGGIFYMHTKGIVHRDLKPCNFLFSERRCDITTNCLKIIDFGLSAKYAEGELLTSRAGTPFYVAPEVIQGRYDSKCDIWSAGVILYILLCGYPPFRSSMDEQEEIFILIQSGRYEFREADWAHISLDAKDLVQRMLSIDPQKRFTAEDCLQHVWIQQLAPHAAKQPLQSAVMEKMSYFASLNKLKKVALHAVAHTLDENQISALRKVFIRLDTNGDGLLSATELEDALMESDGAAFFCPELTKVFRRVDCNKNGVIDYTEFLAATLEIQRFAVQDTLWSAFRVFDKDGSGFISRDELESFLCTRAVEETLEADTIDEIFAEYDTNRDGVIDFQEFLVMMDFLVHPKPPNADRRRKWGRSNTMLQRPVVDDGFTRRSASMPAPGFADSSAVYIEIGTHGEVLGVHPINIEDSCLVST